MGNNRDAVVDLFKGFTILWVIHIHTVYWSGEYYIPGIIRQLSLLIDVPIFFFLSGYLLFNGSPSFVFRRACRQWKRLYLIYLTVSILVLLSICIFRFFRGNPLPPLTMQLVDIVMVQADFSEFKGYAWNLWFLRTYLVMLIIMPILALWPQSRVRNLLLTTFAFLAFVIMNFTYPASFKGRLDFFATFYAAIFLLGFTIHSVADRIRNRHLLWSLMAVLGLLAIVFHLDGNKLVLQTHKFPPSIPYFLYSLIYIHLFLLMKGAGSHVFSKLPSPIVRLLYWSSREVFTLYLVQSVVCSIPLLFIPLLKGKIPSLLLYIITLNFNVFLTLFLVWGMQYCTSVLNGVTIRIRQQVQTLVRG